MRAGERTLAVDLGGTHMRAAVVTATGAVANRRLALTPHADPRPDALVTLVRSALAEAGTPEHVAGAIRDEAGPPGDVVAAVVGIPGRVDYQAGRLAWAPHLPESWVPELTEEQLSSALGLPVAMANDADLAAVGEAYFGAGGPFADVVYVTVSTGIGAGVVLGGRLVHGRRSMAEVGHTIIDRPAYEAGRPATWELQASGSALDRLAAEVGIDGGGPEVERLAAGGDPRAAKIWASIVAAVTVGLLNVVQLFSPDVIVMGGGVGLVGTDVEIPGGGVDLEGRRADLAGEGLLGLVRRHLAANPLPGLGGPVRVVRAGLGDDAALAGAAAWSRAFDPRAASREG